jgi:hypothetical protein
MVDGKIIVKPTNLVLPLKENGVWEKIQGKIRKGIAGGG